jgi:hypothetical protein
MDLTGSAVKGWDKPTMMGDIVLVYQWGYDIFTKP